MPEVKAGRTRPVPKAEASTLVLQEITNRMQAMDEKTERFREERTVKREQQHQDVMQQMSGIQSLLREMIDKRGSGM